MDLCPVDIVDLSRHDFDKIGVDLVILGGDLFESIERQHHGVMEISKREVVDSMSKVEFCVSKWPQIMEMHGIHLEAVSWSEMEVSGNLVDSKESSNIASFVFLSLDASLKVFVRALFKFGEICWKRDS